jgi:glycosyltransferase involved in cell wall biosynthesis
MLESHMLHGHPVNLAIVIPALNEARDLPRTLEALPRTLDGVSTIDIIVVDDGSTDGTADIALASGADFVVQHTANRGLSRAYSTGVTAALQRGATLIVQTDADGQYDARDIPALISPVLTGEADLVVGTRPIQDIADFSWMKRQLQRLGSWVVRLASGTSVLDAPSGFRAMSATAARQLQVHNAYTYTLETLIQAGRSGLRVASVPVRVTGPTRPSRLVRSVPSYVTRSTMTIIRIAVMYRPFRLFAILGTVALLAGGGLIVRFAVFYTSGRGQGNVQSLVIAGMLVTVAIQAFMTAFMTDAIAANRRLSQRLIDLQLQLFAQGRGDRSD